MWFYKANTCLVVAIVVLLAQATTGCGFKPIHASGKQGLPRHVLANIEIAPTKDRRGQFLYNRLLDRLNPQGEPADPLFRLVTTLDETIERVGFKKNEFATRANLRMQAHYSLLSLVTGATLISNRRSVVASYNILNSDFATLSSENEARQSSIRELADEIVTRVNIYFAANPGAANASNPP
jgi:LPS-assembly lipoprotein